jgi:GNAT superfamily N-acetyltransferase
VSAGASTGLWWTRVVDPAATDPVVDLRGYDSVTRPPATVSDQPSPEQPLVVVRANPSGTRVATMRFTRGLVAPTLWWVEHPESSADPPAMTLMGFTAPVIDPGAVIDQARFRELGTRSSAQVGAVRWWPSTGQIHQIYVGPDHRRQGIGTALLFAAASYSRARQWPLLWGSGQRTDLGEAFVTQGHDIITGRVERRTHRLPPMTPGEA